MNYLLLKKVYIDDKSFFELVSSSDDLGAIAKRSIELRDSIIVKSVEYRIVEKHER